MAHENERLRRLYQAISEATEGIIRLPDRQQVFQRVCEVLVRSGGFPLAWIGGPDSGGERLECLAASGSTHCLDHLEWSLRASDEHQSSPPARAFHSGAAQVVTHLGVADSPLDRELGRHFELPALAVFPLRQRGKVVSVLAIHASRTDCFDETAVSLLSELAVDVSFALDDELRERDLAIAAAAFEVQEGIVVTDSSNVIKRVNRAFTRITGYEPAEVVGKTPALLQSGYHDTDFYRGMWRQITDTGIWEGEIWNRRKNGKTYPQWLTISAVEGPGGRVTHYVGSFLDITDYKESEKRIHQLAFYDPLTELANRRLMIDRLGRALALSTRNQTYGALLMLDFDHFKMLNDTRGHAAGDILLVEAAKRLKRRVRESDSVARIGGDEFIVVLEGLDPDEDIASGEAVRRAHQLQSALGKPYALSAVNDYRITVSVGIALFKGHDLLVDDLLKQADVALYEAKADGRNALRFFNPERQKAIEFRVGLEEELRRALSSREFVLHYQPQVDREGRMIGAEALLRWTPPGRDPISPLEFIPVAEETGQIMALGDWVLSDALAQLRAWRDDPVTRHLTLSVNISAKHFRQPGFADEMRRYLERSDADPARLCLELTENVGIEPIERIIVQFNSLKALKVRFSIDDFGTGYSSLSYIQRLPVDQIKIDRKFVAGLPDDPNSAALVRAILAMGHAFGLHVIAEGVENERQREYLLREGCDAFQGFHIGKPVPAPELRKLLSSSRQLVRASRGS